MGEKRKKRREKDSYDMHGGGGGAGKAVAGLNPIARQAGQSLPTYC